MAVSLLFFAVICSGSVFCSVWCKKKFEEILPITVMSIILVLFLFGLMNLLSAGVYVVLGLSAVLYGAAAFKLTRDRRWRQELSGFFSVGCGVFIIIYIALNFLNRGRLAHTWDEFTHWVDVVKAMTYVDDFSTNPLANSHFQSYPPGMSLLQYFAQKLHFFINSDREFVEWRIYLCYQVFFVSVLLPFFKDIKAKRPISLILTAIITCLSPLTFFEDIYTTVYIDAILGILSAAGFARMFLAKEKDWAYHLYIWLVCCMLMLMKDVGMMFGIFIMLGYCADLVYSIHKLCDRKSVCRTLFCMVVAVAVPMLVKMLWSWEVATSGALVAFSGKVDFSSLINVLLGRENSYRTTVIANYFNALTTTEISLGFFNNQSYLGIIILFTIISYLIWLILGSFKMQTKPRKALLILQVIQCVAYVLGLCVMYMYKFSEYESVRLASFSRYLNIAFLATWLMLLLIIANTASYCFESYKIKEAAVLLAIVLCIPMRGIADIIKGDKANALAIRSNYVELSDKTNRVCDGDDRVYLVSQEDNGFDFWVFRFNIRPNKTNPSFSWSLGVPFYEDDIYSQNLTAEQWQADLLANYHYVALYKINDYFIEHYGSVFADPEEIASNEVYLVNKTTGLLELCQ